jgi:hypothetical protein
VWCKVGWFFWCGSVFFYETYLVFIDLTIFIAWRILRCASVSPTLFLWRPVQRAAEQQPDEERVGSDPRLGFAAFFTPRAAAYVAFFAPKNWVCNQEIGLGENVGLEKLNPRERALRTGLENGPREQRGPGEQGNQKNRRLHPRLYYSRL